MKMASFLAGFGGGYLKAKDKALEDERRAKQDAWQEEVQGRQRKEWESKDRLDADLKDAVTPVAVEQPDDVLKDDDGNDMPAVPAFRAGTKRFATMEEATKAANELNTPEAQSTRVLDAYKRNGQFDKALTMQTAMRQGELGEIQLANAKFQQRIGDWMGGGFDGFRDGLNGYEGGPFKGKKVDFVLSEDGKTRSVVSIGPDGQPQPTGLVVPNTNEGLYQLGYILDKSVTPADRLKMHRDEKKLEIEQQKADAADKRNEAYMQSLLARSGGSGGGGSVGGKVGTNGGAATAAFDPYEGFDSKNAQSAATDLVDAAIANGGKPVSSQERARLISDQVFKLRDAYAAQNASRQRASVFMSAARQAQTPEQIEAVRARAKASGYTDAEMASLDQRFAPKQAAGTAENPFAGKQPAAADPVKTASTNKPAPKPVEPKGPAEFQQFQRALQMGYQAAGRGNAAFGAGEVLYVNPKTGDRKWASQLFAQ